ncbi:MAG: hypothetical protein OXH08_07990 [Gammaproteobacteria bacterium]|nr:hypothetical protein [Gammaproteobacteria bacterium]
MPNYFLTCDILGFSKMVSNLDSNTLQQRIRVWIDLVEAARHSSGVEEVQFISDTVFAREENSGDGLMRLLAFARLLLEKGIGRACPVRGAISHGEVAWGRLTYGKAVLDAHRLEVSQDWIGFSCAPGLPRIDSMWSWDRVVVYPVPKQTGNIQLAPVLVWNVPALQQLANRTTSEGLYQEGELLPWEWQQKLIQTVLFAKSIEHGRKSRHLSPSNFAYTMPADLLNVIGS